MEKFLDSMVIVARGASRNVRMFPLTVLFTFTMVIIINCILGLTTTNSIVRLAKQLKYKTTMVFVNITYSIC